MGFPRFGDRALRPWNAPEARTAAFVIGFAAIANERHQMCHPSHQAGFWRWFTLLANLIEGDVVGPVRIKRGMAIIRVSSSCCFLCADLRRLRAARISPSQHGRRSQRVREPLPESEARHSTDDAVVFFREVREQPDVTIQRIAPHDNTRAVKDAVCKGGKNMPKGMGPARESRKDLPNWVGFPEGASFRAAFHVRVCRAHHRWCGAKSFARQRTVHAIAVWWEMKF